MRRFGAAFIAALLVVGLFVPAAFAASPAAHGAVPKVVFIVGPAGAATSGYRAQARSAATIARQYTPDVVELYSPNATWTAVKDALKGASLVVYMGHGNGWPSRYRDSLYPVTQDGFGLNPIAGGGDYQHQYFGEASVASEVKLAKNAVVLLNHLCYASGNSEPGLPEGTLDVARQRVDNYAAGFVRAGASAVIAEAWSSPSYFVSAILGGGRSIQTAWLKSPSANGHRIAFQSQRSPGYVAQMDPENATSGFERSIVMKSGLAPKDVLAGAAGSARSNGAPTAPLVPTLGGTGLTLGAPDIASVTTGGSTVNLALPFTIKDRKALPKGLQGSVRWDPIALAVAPVDPATEVAPPAPSAAAGSAPAGSAPAGSAAAAPAASPSATPSPSAAPSPSATAAPSSGPAAKAPQSLGPRRKAFIDAPVQAADLVVPEAPGDVIAPTALKVGKTTFTLPVTLPSVPGLYRLTVTLHDADGVVYDDASQAMIPPLNVRVTGDYDVAIDVVAATQLTTRQEALLGIRVTNIGKLAWGHGAANTPSGRVIPAAAATVVGRWLPLSTGAALDPDPTTQETDASLPITFASGKKTDAILGLTAPSTPGDYLLLLDVVTPERGSLVALGADPTLVRITVVPPG